MPRIFGDPKKRTGPRKDLFKVEIHDGLFQRVNVELQAALQVGGFVLVDDIALGQLVQHAAYLGQQLHRFLLIGARADVPYGVTGGLVLIAITLVAGLALADALDGTLVVGHVIGLEKGRQIYLLPAIRQLLQ